MSHGINVPPAANSGNNPPRRFPCPRCGHPSGVPEYYLFIRSDVINRELKSDVWGICDECHGAAYQPSLTYGDVFSD